jgi:competence protein ComEC
VLRIDMLAVGDGSCFLVRSGGEAILFDAGSSSVPDSGSRIVVPALKRLGVRSLRGVIVSHANFDHYSAVPEVVAALRVECVIVTPQFLDETARDPRGAAAFLVQWLTRRGVAVRCAAGGHEIAVGRARVRWLHPQGSGSYLRANDASAVLRIEAGGRSALLCGDIERLAMSHLLASERSLTADILELPHHGSHHALAEEFVRAAGPEVVLQSSGPRRYERAAPQWDGVLRGAAWLATPARGACWVEVAGDSELIWGSFRGSGPPDDLLPGDRRPPGAARE